MHRLEVLPQLTDTALAHLKVVRTLGALQLAGAAVTDAGLKHLQGLPALRELDPPPRLR